MAGGKLTAKQAAFVERVAKGVRPREAAELAGYSAPSQDAYKLMRLPHVVQQLRDRRQARIDGDLAGVAVETMHELMTDESTPAATRFSVSKWVLEHAGHGDMLQDGAHAKPMEEMSGDELAQAIASGMQALQDLAGQMAGQHVVDGQVRPVEVIEHEPDTLDFLQ